MAILIELGSQRQLHSIYQDSSKPSNLKSLPLWVSSVEPSRTLKTPLALSWIVTAAFSKPKASAPRSPRSDWTQLFLVLCIFSLKCGNRFMGICSRKKLTLDQRECVQPEIFDGYGLGVPMLNSLYGSIRNILHWNEVLANGKYVFTICRNFIYTILSQNPMIFHPLCTDYGKDQYWI